MGSRTDLKIREFPFTEKYQRYAILFDGHEIWSTNRKHVEKLVKKLENFNMWEDIPQKEKQKIADHFHGYLDWKDRHITLFPELCGLINNREKVLAYGSETIVLGKFIEEFGYPVADNKRWDDMKDYTKAYEYYAWLYFLTRNKMDIN